MDKENDKENRGFSIAGDLLGGQFLTRQKMTSQWFFILYIFLLTLLYITINLGVEKTQLTQRRNQRELKNLKADYTSKAAKLQYQSKRGEIELKLIDQGSALLKPSHPAKLVERIK
ncbi:MAG: FtsL-like putative cell division protein [Bacteroidales bacterium]